MVSARTESASRRMMEKAGCRGATISAWQTMLQIAACGQPGDGVISGHELSDR
jgi:hypothetical protein